MRDVYERMVEEARSHGLEGSDAEIVGWLKGPLFGLWVKLDKFIQFPNDRMMQIIFHCLTIEGLVCRNREYNGPHVFGQPYYELTAGGVYLAQQAYEEYAATQTKH